MAQMISLPDLLYGIKDNDDDNVKFFGFCVANKHLSKSQNFQDVWALHEFNRSYKSNLNTPGYFVEFGATNGVDGSNTYMLHKDYGWYGVVAEPNPAWHESLRKNRENHRCHIVTECVYTESNKKLPFLITDEPDLSTIQGYGDDEHSSKRTNAKCIEVNTISLCDMLDDNDAPYDINYLSVDTEGSEYDILKAFFDDKNSGRYNIQCITVEHNYNQENRDRLFNLLTSNGYKRKFEAFSRWDDFYIKDV